MSKRFRKDYGLDGWPILDNKIQSILGTNDIVNTLNDFNDDPRLSDDPLTALAAVIREHGLTLLVDGLLIDKDNKIIFESTDEVITESEIKPESNQ